MVNSTELFIDFDKLEQNYIFVDEKNDLDMNIWNKLVSNYCELIRVDQNEFLNAYNTWKETNHK